MADRVGQQLGNYRLLRLLGRGAFAEVYLGEHQYLEIPAAIKVLSVQMEPEMQESFRREARTIAHLQHPHIVRVLEFGFQDQTPYLVMEYLPNGTLRKRHPTGTRLPLEQIVTYVKQLAPALDYAHQQRVIHRDVKPENLLLNAQHELVLSDFGIAVVQQTRESLSTQNPAGTPLYMAPEQIQGKPCAASDQYALAVVVYEWLCGEPPFRGSLFEVYSQHLYQPPPGLCARLPQLPSIVEDAVLGALAKDPQQRFSSVQDFATVLEEACFATQPPASPILLERQGQDQQALPATLSALAPRTGEEDLSGETTPLRLIASQPTADEQEPLRSVTPLPVVPGQTVSKQARSSVAQTNRERLLRKVRAFWITGVLEHSLHGAALIALGLAQQPEAVAHPWQLALYQPAGPPRPLAAGTRITQVYDAAEGELLILGAPGSGKTTLLLELARDLLDRAEHDEQHPLPVVFNLSFWASKQQPLADWLVEELNRTYQVPHTLGQAWVEADQILPLLDGLDEVALKDRTRCIETINTYRQEHGLLPLVVCSRSADYLAQTARIQLSSAVAVQPLTQRQVDDYLASGGEPLRALQVALHQDAVLRELTETPLMLSILTLTYHDMPIEDLLRGGIAPTRQQVFEHYVERMLTRRGVPKYASREQTLRWLTFLAAGMQRHHQSTFFLEALQPDWLKTRWSRWVYRVSLGLVIGLIFGLAIGLFIGLAAGLVAGRVGLAIGLFIGLAAGLVYGLVYGSSQIQLREVLTWSWKGRKENAVVGVRVGLVIVLVIVLVNGLIEVLAFGLVGRLVIGLVIGPVYGLVGGLLAGLLAGFSQNQLDDCLRCSPNQGIWYSARTGLVYGLVYGLVGGPLAWLLDWPLAWLLAGLVFNKLFYGLATVLVNGLLAGLLAGLSFGLGAFFQHFTLRFWLWRMHSLPRNVVAFLDEAAERLLLRKVGGGYIFIHRLLLEYFASLDTTPTPDAARAKK